MSGDTINTWDIIDTFFRDTEYYKSQHQIDSFNEFIFSNENGIENVYLELPEVNLETVIARNSDVHEEIDADFKEQQSARDSHFKQLGIDTKNIFAEADAEYGQFKKDAQK